MAFCQTGATEPINNAKSKDSVKEPMLSVRTPLLRCTFLHVKDTIMGFLVVQEHVECVVCTELYGIADFIVPFYHKHIKTVPRNQKVLTQRFQFSLPYLNIELGCSRTANRCIS